MMAYHGGWENSQTLAIEEKFKYNAQFISRYENIALFFNYLKFKVTSLGDFRFNFYR